MVAQGPLYTFNDTEIQKHENGAADSRSERLRRSGGSDGTRTRGLWRDRPAL